MNELSILIVSPYFAPYSGVGANRMVSLSVYLRDLGHKLTVLRNVEDIQRHMYTAREPENISYCDIVLKDNLLFKEKESLYCDKIAELMKENSFHCVIISLGPYYSLKAAKEIKNNYNIPIILDFRDLFAYEVIRHETIKDDIGQIVFHKKRVGLERPAVELADAVVVVTPDDERRMKKHYSGYSPKIVMIPNGYDEQRLKKLANALSVEESKKTEETIEIGFFGKLSGYSEKYTKDLFKAIKRVQNKGHAVRMIHMGAREPRNIELAKKIGLQAGSYCYMGSKEYSEGMDILSRTDFLSMVYCSPSGYGTKIFDYIFLNKPILLMGRTNTVLSKLINSFENGFACSSVGEYEQALLKVINDKKKILESGLDVTLYSRRVQNEKFLNLIYELIN